MHSISIKEINETVALDLINEAISGGEIIISENEKPVVRISNLKSERPKAKFGSSKGIINFMTDDFDETPDDFKEYLQ